LHPSSRDEFPPHHPYGPWTIEERRVVYEDPWMKVRCDSVLRPDGNPGTYSTVRIKPGVCVIAIDNDDVVHLTKEFHYAVGRDTIEGVSGGIEDTESAEVAANRELAEEIGVIAGSLKELGTVDPLTAALWSPTKLFLATDLSFMAPNPESTEKIECYRLPFSEAVRMVLDSEITHGPTCVAILKIQLLRSMH
jgi:ADP-ribose pyrophosphatase